jgi:FKBP-type peptidyl-prolyl cis-trans isomerase FkpA
LYACGKTQDYGGCPSTGGIPTAQEMADLKAFLTSKNITATEDSRGFYYQISNPGYGDAAPTSSSTVQVKYRGTFTSGAAFDSTKPGEPAIFSLSGTVLGFQYGIPLIKKTGVIDLYLPPSLGYGCAGRGGIPGNSILIFHVDLINY